MNQGIELVNKGNIPEAIKTFHQAIKIDPRCSEAYNNLGILQIKEKCFSEAIQSFCQAIELNPNDSDGYHNLGIAQSENNLWDEAIHSFSSAIKLKSNNPEMYFNLGIAQLHLKKLPEAEVAFSRATELNPYYIEAYFNLGVIYADVKMLDEAIEHFCRAIELSPQFYEAYNNLGAVLRLNNQLDEAEDCLRRAIELKPDYAKAYNNLGLVLQDNHCLEEATVCFRHSIELNPNDPEIYNNLALVLKDTDQLKEAEDCLCRAIELRPGFMEAEFTLGYLYLLQEQYEKGWGKYSECSSFYEPMVKKNEGFPSGIPHWQGEDLMGRKILLFGDQGFGDTIQFLRYADMVAILAEETSIWAKKPLERLIASSIHSCSRHIDGSAPAMQYDFICPLSRLPYLFHTSKDSIPQKNPYIKSNAECVTAWHEKLNALDGGEPYRIGVVWAGNPKHENDRNRSVAFSMMEQLFEIDEVSWISLQVGERAMDISQTQHKIIDISSGLVDFFETAGAIANLDLVITIDSAVAHLAGAMGKETWLLLPRNPDWRWQLKREDSPWYPTMRIFRQQEAGKWQDVFTRVKDAIRKIDDNK